MSDRRALAFEFFEKYRESTVMLWDYEESTSIELEELYRAFAARIVDELASAISQDGVVMLRQKSTDSGISVQVVPQKEWKARL